MLILVGPSASGKTEVSYILIKKYNMEKMITYTTRPMRVGEVNHVSYHFVSKEQFLEMKEKNEFVETAIYNNNYYGTRKKDVTNDKVVILEPSGVQAFKNAMPGENIVIFLNTSESIREERMRNRGDKEEDIKKRLEGDRVVFSGLSNIDYFIDNENETLEGLAKKIYNIYKKGDKKMKVLVETSARHVHLSKETIEVLFGEGYELTKKKDLSQPGQYACEERVVVVGPKKELAGVSILGPARKADQVELSATDARSIGLPIAIKESGDLAGTPGCKLVGPKGEVEIKEGVIVAKRHIHMTTKDAAEFGLENGQVVNVKVESADRSLIFGDVVVRVRDDFALAMHIDTDESNAGSIAPGTLGEIIK